MTMQASVRPAGNGAPPAARGGIPWLGHMLSFAGNPYRFVEKVAREGGEIVSFTMMGQKIVLLTGDEASEIFYRSSDEQLDQSAAYKLMTPIFGEGLVFDAPIARKNEQLRMLMPSLRVEAMRDHSHKIVQEVEDIIADWGDAGEIELVKMMKQLTINTASHCLLGREFRYELSAEFAEIYHDLEQGVHPLAYHFPNLPIPKFRRRDKARKRLQELVGGIVKKRASQAEKPSDMFQTLIDMRYEDGTKLDENEITGLLIGAIFAGHHTSSGTAAWVLLELLKNPPVLRQVRQELDELLGAKGAVTFQSLREMPVLENVLKEVLRLHPPLIILMRKVSEDLNFKGYTIRAGDMVWACPPVTHRLSRLFSNPTVFDPDRFSPERREDRNLMAYQPFGGGKHKCSGNAFAMFQIKAIFAVLLRRYDFELIDAPETYVDNYKDMIVQPMEPCRIRYRRRGADSFTSDYGKDEPPAAGKCPVDHESLATAAAPAVTVVVDRGLCQGHAMCMGEAPGHFQVGDDGVLRIVKDSVSDAEMEAVQSAVNYCPNAALRLERHP
ncbi:MAG: cytochrome P450 [Zavarzinia sp.]|nr:cytochrome P450 [Zavarzinia sp.]